MNPIPPSEGGFSTRCLVMLSLEEMEDPISAVGGHELTGTGLFESESSCCTQSVNVHSLVLEGFTAFHFDIFDRPIKHKPKNCTKNAICC